MQTYRKKIPTVEAAQFTGEADIPALVAWAPDVLCAGPKGLGYLVLREKGGPTRVNVGDWVLKFPHKWEKWTDIAFKEVWELEGTYDAADWMGEYCTVCLRMPTNVAHTHTQAEREAARSRARTWLHRKLDVPPSGESQEA